MFPACDAQHTHTPGVVQAREQFRGDEEVLASSSTSFHVSLGIVVTYIVVVVIAVIVAVNGYGVEALICSGVCMAVRSVRQMGMIVVGSIGGEGGGGTSQPDHASMHQAFIAGIHPLIDLVDDAEGRAGEGLEGHEVEDGRDGAFAARLAVRVEGCKRFRLPIYLVSIFRFIYPMGRCEDRARVGKERRDKHTET